MPDIKGFNARAAQLRPGPVPTYGLSFAAIQDNLVQWLADYGLTGLLAIQWRRQDDGHHVPVLLPQAGPGPIQED